MICFIEKYGLLAKQQYGFRKKRSCVHAMIKMTDFMRNTVDKKCYGLALYVDFKKAFDTVDHAILLDKLDRLGFRGKFHLLLKDYLSKSYQYVETNGKQSKMLEIKCGVPQGSILGPLLFLLYINDFPDFLRTSEVALFADDTTILSSSKNSNFAEQFCDDVKRIDDWCANNKLTVHPSMCKLQQFGKKHIELKEIKLGVEKLDYTTNFKYLGVLLDCELNFSDQIESVCTKLRKFNGIMYRARTCFSKYHLSRVYSAYIIPIMSYGLIAYGCGAKSNIDKIDLVQKKILRTIFFKRKNDHITNVFIEYNIHTVFDLFFIQIFRETFRQLRNGSLLKFLIRDKT